MVFDDELIECCELLLVGFVGCVWVVGFLVVLDFGGCCVGCVVVG